MLHGPHRGHRRGSPLRPQRTRQASHDSQGSTCHRQSLDTVHENSLPYPYPHMHHGAPLASPCSKLAECVPASAP